jgi:hypothetical protein
VTAVADAAATRLRRGLARIGRRSARLASARGGAAGLAAAAGILLALHLAGAAGVVVPVPPLPASAALALLGLGMGAWLGRWRHDRRLGRGIEGAARIVERSAPASRNLVRTAEELERTGVAEGAVREAILDDAVRFVDALEPARLLPAHRTGLALAGALALGAVAVLTAPGSGGDPLPVLTAVGSTVGETVAQGAATLLVTVVPPAWIGGPGETHLEPERLHVLEGSRLRLEVRPSGPARPTEVTVETVEGVRPLEPGPDGAFGITLPALADGFLAFEGRGPGGAALFRGMVGLTVFPDEAPRIRITEPGRDLYLPSGDRALDLVIEATDDHALADLELVYTRVAGFGELFEFEEGTLPLDVERHAPGQWTARATWDLSTLALDRGESVVYHARGRDRRPGAPAATSETWIVEVLGGDAAVSGGFAGDDEMTRYALSQQMLLVFTRRLQQDADTLSADDLLRESRTLAAGQRRVRAEFVFMLGGELADEDHVHGDDPFAAADDDHDHDDEPPDPDAPQDLHEEAHARADQDAAEGRLAQQGRQELSRAVQAMSRAATFLNVADLPAALEAEQVALEHLQRAFSSSRYILRAMTEREELDLGRRLTGSMAGAGPDPRPGVAPGPDPEALELRSILAEVAARPGRIAARTPAGTPARGGSPADDDVATLLGLASRVLALKPGDAHHQEVAGHLRGAADALEGGGASGEVARTLLHEAAAGLAALLRARVAPAPPAGASAPLRLIDGLLARELAADPAPGAPGGPP